MENQKKWGRFAFELDKLLYFWIFGILYFLLFRIAFIFLFKNELHPDTSIGDYANALFMGFKFDATIMGYFLLVPFAILFLFSFFNKFRLISSIRSVFQYLFVFLSAFICIITLNYYWEYKSQFNSFLFLALYEDDLSIVKTIYQYYNFYLNFLIIILLLVAGIAFFRLTRKKRIFTGRISKITSIYGQILIVLLAIGLLISSMRGTFTNSPAKRRWAYVTKDDFLNKTILNPYSSLRYAYADFRELNGEDSSNPFLKDNPDTVFKAEKVSDVIAKVSSGNTIEKPRQIFLVLMESYDYWSMMDKYKAFGVSQNLKNIADKGMEFTHMLPANVSTFDAYSTLVAGVPYCGVNTSLLGTKYEPYVSSIFNQFKKMGYKTNLFYGGFISWQNIGEFTKYQGCENVYSAVDMGGKSEIGAWAVEDERLFDFVLNHLDDEEYTFNVILTSSRHAPYDIDVYAKGFPYKKVEDIPAEVRPYFDGAMSLIELGHVWYGDYAIGKFMEKADVKYKDALFAFTGDHFGRKFINHFPNLYEKSLVPFILYGKEIPAGKNDTPASHMDVLPTLIEMIAPEGFEYYSFGKSVFEMDKNSAFSFTKAIDRDSIYYFQKDALVEEINLADFKDCKTKTNKYQSSYDSIMGLAWHYIMKGNSLK